VLGAAAAALTCECWGAPAMAAWEKLSGRRRDAILVAALAAATCAVYFPLVQGVPPLSTDHNYHLLKVVETERLLRSGRLFGWTDMEFAGYPHNVLYPFAGYLVTAAIHALPGVSLSVAYAWTVLLAILSVVLAAYVAGRLQFSRGVGVLAALFALLDPGGLWVGGHLLTLKVGIWPPAVAGALVLLALALIPRALTKPTGADLAIPGALIGIAALFHPLALFLAAAAAVPMAIAIATTTSIPPRTWIRAGGWVAAGALAACAFWFIPFVRARAFNILPSFWPPTAVETWKAIVEARYLHQPALWFGATVCGLLMLAARREPFSRFIVIFVPAAVVFATREAVLVLGLLRAADKSGFQVLQVERLHFLIRPLCFLATAYALVTLVPAAVRWLGARDWQARAMRGLAVITTTAFMLVPGLRLPGLPDVPVPNDLTAVERVQVEAALDAAAPLVAPGDRLALFTTAYDHCLVGPAALRGIKTEKMGTIASTMFKTQFSTDRTEAFWAPHAELMARLGATAILSKGPPPSPYREAPLVGRFGPFELRKLPKEPRAWVEGPGAVEVLAWEDEEIRLRVQGAAPESRLHLALGYYDAWREESGLPLSPEGLDQQHLWRRLRLAELTALPARDGERILRYHRPAAQWIGLAVTLALGAALIWLSARQRRGALDRML